MLFQREFWMLETDDTPQMEQFRRDTQQEPQWGFY